MASLSSAFTSLTDLKLWLKIRAGQTLSLADVPRIIPLRYSNFRDNWEFIKKDLIDRIPDADDPDRLKTEIDEMSELIEVQRSSLNKRVNPFSNSKILTDYYAVFDNIIIQELPVTKEEQTIIDQETARVTAFIKTDFINLRSNLVKTRDELADEVAGQDVTYNNIYRRSSVTSIRTITIKDIQNMQQLQNGISTVDTILANASSVLQTVSVDPFLLARQNANNDDLVIEQGKSGRLVKMFVGDDLEALAHRYLGDKNRWMEIAIANGLKPPYIDEIGQRVFLLSNGNGNQINIAKLDANSKPNIDKFYIGQALFLTSDTVKFPEQRSIVSLREIPISGEIVLELSGDNDLDKYKINENANVRVYLPNTINSNFLITVPTPTPVPTQVGQQPYFLSDKAEDEKLAKVDLSVNNDFDLVFTPSSDFQVSFGVPNAVQAIKLKLVQEKGQSKNHPLFGVASIMGEKTDDIGEVRGALATSITDMIEADNRFDRVENLGITQSGTAFVVRLDVRMAGSGTVVPISFVVNTG